MTALTANLLLMLAAAIWGFAFVAQRVGMDHMGPFTFNAIRFAIGALSLIPVIAVTRKRQKHRASRSTLLLGGVALGVVLFGAATAQQVGLVTTTAGKAGFITGLYVVLVPVLALVWGERASWFTWLGAALAVAGLYFLTLTESLVPSAGDAWVMLSAFLFAVQIQLVGFLTQRTDPLPLAGVQFAVCALLSGGVAALSEPLSWSALQAGLWPILYGGLMSVGVAYSLQAVTQRYAPPAPAAIIMSLESAFAALGGGLILGERLGARGGAGAVLMMVGMVLAQIRQGETKPGTLDPARGVPEPGSPATGAAE